MLAIGISLLPGLLFLQGLWLLDVYRLLSMRRVFIAVAWGALSALAIMPVNTAAHGTWGAAYLHYGAPIAEEFVKAAILLVWLRQNRIGFLVDASILGFAVGTGFSLIENLVYLNAIPDGGLLLWAIRGCGTAMLHGVATACVATLVLALSGSGYAKPVKLVLAFAPSIALHIFYNSGAVSPTIMAPTMILSGLVLMVLVFTVSERMLAGWLNANLGEDIAVWDMIQTGQIEDSDSGRYLHRLCSCFPPDQLQELFRLVRIHIELRTQAKGEMILRQHGLPIEPDPALPGKLQQLSALEHNVGLAGRRAIAPLIGSGRRSTWEIHHLKEK